MLFFSLQSVTALELATAMEFCCCCWCWCLSFSEYLHNNLAGDPNLMSLCWSEVNEDWILKIVCHLTHKYEWAISTICSFNANASTVQLFKQLSFYTVLTGNRLCAGCWCTMLTLYFFLLVQYHSFHVRACSCSCLFSHFTSARTSTCRQRFMRVIQNDFQNLENVHLVRWLRMETERWMDGRTNDRTNGWNAWMSFFSTLALSFANANINSCNKLVRRTAPSVNAECISCI